jgi:hypothetical protein
VPQNFKENKSTKYALLLANIGGLGYEFY